MKKHLITAIRILITVLALGLIIWFVDWKDTPEHDGILTVLKKADRMTLVGAFLLLMPVYGIQTMRWWMLMRCRGITVPMHRAFRLLMVGCFFNYTMPGSTGGDVVKAYYAAAKSERRADAVMSVIFDRIAGLLGLILLAGVAGLFMLDHPIAREVTLYIWLSAAGIVLVSAIYFSKRLRNSTGLEAMLAKLPDKGMVSQLDQASVAYRDHKMIVLLAMFMSVPVHILTSSSIALSGYAIGVEESFGVMLTVVPVISLGGAIPISYQGLGVMEAIGKALIKGGNTNQIVIMLMLVRFYMVTYSLLGGLFLMRGDIHLHPKEFEQEESQIPEVE
jgi:hypothetical protein